MHHRSGVVLFSSAELAAAEATRTMRSGRSFTDPSCRRPVATSLARTDYTSDSRTEYELVQDGSIPPILQAPPSPPAPRSDWHILESDGTKLVVSARAIFFGVVVGVGLGVLVSRVPVLKTHLGLWIALPGDLFVRALRCLVLPMVFTGITVAIAETVAVGKTAMLGLRTIGMYFVSSLLAAALGMSVALLARPWFSPLTAPSLPSNDIALGFKCANGLYLQSSANESLACSSPTPTAFLVDDINNVLATTSGIRVSATKSATAQALAMLDLLVTDNIMRALADGSLLSVVMFALPLGVAIVRSHHSSALGTAAPPNPLLLVLRQIRNAFLILIHALLRLTPIAVVFLISGAMSSLDANAATLHQVLIVLGAYLLATALHTLVVLPLLMCVLTKTNPFAYLRHLTPAFAFAFGCASSMATLPVALAGLEATRAVPRSLAQVIMALGTTVNMNAAGLYYPLMTVFMAASSNRPIELDSTRLVLLFFMSLLGAMGTAPVPNAGLVMLLTVWKTVLPTEPVPPAFALVVAIDFLIDRISTVVNVNGNVVVTRILADQVDEAAVVWAQEHVDTAA
ncbi:dicarboxylate/amino acid:cation (Na or H) symporter (DAACS) family protein [Achlya hypogyna]|uniref:Amino acid transporter n=1 Tax=Achlya hypogyna TaxID=1202772 RepID=A0A1V9YH21_ACHHY|nr:dicarboxylate/amino acid:cation (Na or H) symporter (DAACS) family protein [Achlya hypogyna]